MPVVTWFMKKPRLSTLIDTAGGSTVIRALRAADENILTLRDEAQAAVDAVLDELELLVASAPDDAADWLGRVYALSSSLLDVSGPCGLGDMCKAAYSLCDLVDRQKQRARCELAPIRVHVASLRLLSHPDQSPESRELVLAGLEKVLARESRAAG